MHNEKDCSWPNLPKRDEPLFTYGASVGLRQGIRVVEYQPGCFETDAVFPAVRAVLLFVPFEQHGALSSGYKLYVQLSISKIRPMR
jgi:hypothetical protein